MRASLSYSPDIVIITASFRVCKPLWTLFRTYALPHGPSNLHFINIFPPVRKYNAPARF